MQGISCECARGKGTAALARLDREPCRPSGEGQRDGRRDLLLGGSAGRGLADRDHPDLREEDSLQVRRPGGGVGGGEKVSRLRNPLRSDL